MFEVFPGVASVFTVNVIGTAKELPASIVVGRTILATPADTVQLASLIVKPAGTKSAISIFDAATVP